MTARRPGLWRELGLPVLAAVLLALLLRAVALEVVGISGGAMAPTLRAGDQVAVWKLAYQLRLPLAGTVLELAAPRRCDVVVFANPLDPDRDGIQRVVGLPGDVVELRDGVLRVNGVPQPQEPAGQLRYQERSPQSGRWLSETCPLALERLAAGPVAPPRDGSPAAEAEAWREAAAAGARTHGLLHCRPPQGDQEGPFERVLPGHLFLLGDNRDRARDSRSEGRQVPLRQVRGRAALVLVGLSPEREAWIERLFKPIE